MWKPVAIELDPPLILKDWKRAVVLVATVLGAVVALIAVVVFLCVLLALGTSRLHAQSVTGVDITCPPHDGTCAVTPGTEPTWTTEPVTQKVPHCHDGQVLAKFEEDNRQIADLSQLWGQQALITTEPHGDRWVPASNPVDKIYWVMEEPIYRCFQNAAEMKAGKSPLPTSATVTIFKDGKCIAGCVLPNGDKITSCQDGAGKPCDLVK